MVLGRIAPSTSSAADEVTLLIGQFCRRTVQLAVLAAELARGFHQHAVSIGGDGLAGRGVHLAA